VKVTIELITAVDSRESSGCNQRTFCSHGFAIERKGSQGAGIDFAAFSREKSGGGAFFGLYFHFLAGF